MPAFTFASGSRDDAVARGSECLINVEGSIIHQCVRDIPFVAIADDAKYGLPAHLVEYIYARLIMPDADCYDEEFGISQIDVGVFLKIEDVLTELISKGKFANTVCSFQEFMRRLADLPNNPAFNMNAVDLIACEQHAHAVTANKSWFDEIKLVDLTDGSGRLSPWADLSGLMGPRTLAASRLLVAPPGRFARMASSLQRAVRTSSALDAAPDNGNVFLKMPDDKDDLFFSIGMFLVSNALPLELCVLPTSMREAATDLRYRVLYASDDGRAVVLKERFTTFLTVFEHLGRVLRTGHAYVNVQWEFARLLADKLKVFGGIGSVAAFYALEREVARFTYVLDEGAGDVDLTIQQRALRVIAAAEGAVARARDSSAGSAAPTPHTSAAAGISAETTAVATCFGTHHADAMERFMALHSAEMNKKLNTPEDDSFVDSPIESADGPRIIRACFLMRKLPMLQFLMRPASNSRGVAVFREVAPFRTGIAVYLAMAVTVGDDGVIPRQVRGFELGEQFVRDFLALKWEKLDFYNGLKGAIDAYKAPTEHHFRTWPNEVFGNSELVRHVKELGDKLFSAIGFKPRKATNFFGKVAKLQAFLDNEMPAESHPHSVLAECFKSIVASAAMEMRQAMAAGPDFAFPKFGSDSDPWISKLENLADAASGLRAQDALRPRQHGRGAHSSGPAVQFSAAPARAGARSPSPAPRVSHTPHPSAAPAAAPLKSALKTPGGDIKGRVGERKSDVTQNASIIRIRIRRSAEGAQYAGNTHVTLQWKTSDVKKIVMQTEGTEAKCLSCACIKFHRHLYCTTPGAPGHESPTSSAHTFVGRPWELLSTDQYVTRL